MALKLYNTLTRTKTDFQPIDPNNVRMYVCGPTVYDYAHIGNARPVIVFDVLFRLLRHIYGPDHVTYVRNITDVDDKINARALRDYPDLPLNDAIRKVTTATETQFHDDIATLGVMPPTYEPRATEHIADMIKIIQALVDRGHAYIAAGDDGHEVIFDIASMPDYGALSQRKLEEQLAGVRVEVDAHKRQPGDFVLWKASSSNEPGWPAEFRPDTAFRCDSRWNTDTITIFGRPGWHIECSAMSQHFLGEEFDLHGGGLDLIFPHHENEIAQSRCAHGTPVMANVWMHNGFLQVEGEKMSKSLGNFVTIHELLNTTKFGGRKWAGEVLRLAMLMTHYRQPIDWTASRLNEALIRRSGWLGPEVSRGVPEKGEVSDRVVEGLKDDLNLGLVFSVLDEMAARKRSLGEGEPATIANDLAKTLVFLGLAANSEFDVARADKQHLRDTMRAAKVGVDLAIIEKGIADRSEARKRKDFAESDRIRDELAKMGIALKDTKNKETGEIETTWEVLR